ncbi:MAG TPA: hypothetical protein VJT31_28955, partial [Rugosimonospora sp.]|nr:hypothetical protein [Rugosimonospora sp.]
FNGTIPGYGAATFTVSRAGVASYGTATAAVRLTIEPANHLATIVETLVAVRQGTVLMVLTHTGLTDHDDNVTGSATARAYARLRQVA